MHQYGFMNEEHDVQSTGRIQPAIAQSAKKPRQEPKKTLIPSEESYNPK